MLREHIEELAVTSIGDRGRAIAWLRAPNEALGGQIPVDVLDTELGVRQVENLLGRIAYGGLS